MKIDLPYKLKPYAHQLNTWRALFIDKYRFVVSVIHRRGGKTIGVINTLVAAGLQRKGLYGHSFPTLKQAREVCFEGMDNDGVPLIERIPTELISRIDKVTMSVYLVNGSIIKWLGTDQVNTKMGGNYLGMVYDEFSLQKPEVYHYMSPMFAANRGWQQFVYTPRGKNHGYDIMELAKKNKDFFFQLCTVDDTKKHDGTPIITPEFIEQERAAGIPEEIIQQEYYCSFEASLVGNYYGNHIKKAREQGRIGDFKIDTTLPVYTFWDLGGAKEGSDATAIWFVQKDKEMLNVIYYYETNLTPLHMFPNILRDISTKLGIGYSKHFAPCDINIVELGSGKSRLSIARSVGLKFQVLPGKLWNKPRIDGIECVWRLFYKLRFHETNCQEGLRALNEYRKEFDDRKRCYKDQPLHDWTSHASDAFRYFALIWKDSFTTVQSSQLINLRNQSYQPL